MSWHKRKTIAVTLAASVVLIVSLLSLSTPPVTVSHLPTVTPPSAPVRCHVKMMSSDPQSVEPDPTCTPGATNAAVTQETIHTTICSPGYMASIRPTSGYTYQLKIQSMRDYGYADKNSILYEEDHFIPLELGGNPTSPLNLWAEYDGGRIPNEKDKLEDYLHTQVCSGKMSLSTAQHIIANDWYKAFQSTGL